ncbi:inositol-phosphate transport system permease protein [Monaibacterium marinum]|uniref:Inositol-phosphate transport system permease protein n=1 Tax=Pontivivens marinum TaxID=1690039 RepID=A0A2C9CNV8_9RHOB|nr:sugar ABC transporter permease [Monaibacterium marinum]SOH92912.1 inositol-phosphate transport system permease protein [Monaibacterium marinum]
MSLSADLSGTKGAVHAHRPTGTAMAQDRGRPRVSRLGLILVAPALFLLSCFFLAPVVLTGVFAFTNMSTSTGIGAGEYVISPNLLDDLADAGLSEEVVTAISAETYEITPDGIEAARAGGVSADFLRDIEGLLLGDGFDTARGIETALRGLPSAPRSPRSLKLTAEFFGHSVLNQRFDSAQELTEALSLAVPDVDAGIRSEIVGASYTGAIYTTENFTYLATQPSTMRLVANTVIYVGATLSIFNVGLGLFLAITLFYMPKRVSSFYSTLWLLPRITPLVLYTIMWKWFTWEDGFLPLLAEQLGLPAFNYMKGSVITAWMTMISVNGFVGASFGLILFSGAIRAIPTQQLWASEVDGATRWQQIRRIILPQMRWPILFVVSYQTLSLLSSYESIWLTTNGGPGKTTTVWALEAFKTALSSYTGNLEYGLGAAMALVLVVVGLALSIIYLMAFKFGELVGRPRIEF